MWKKLHFNRCTRGSSSENKYSELGDTRLETFFDSSICLSVIKTVTLLPSLTGMHQNVEFCGCLLHLEAYYHFNLSSEDAS